MLVNRPGLLQHTFTCDGAYRRDTVDDHVQLRERGPQITQSSRALKLRLSLTTFGLDAFREAVAHGIELAEHVETTAHDRATRPKERRAGIPPALPLPLGPLLQHVAGLVRSEREVGVFALSGGSVRGADRVGKKIVNRLGLTAQGLSTGLNASIT